MSLHKAKEQPKTEDRTSLMCTARGCPMRWSCDMGNGKLCSWHDTAEPKHWPEITAELVAVLASGQKPALPPLRARKHAPMVRRPATTEPQSIAAALPKIGRG